MNLLSRMAALLAGLVLTAGLAITTASPASAESCRDIAHEITGAYTQFRLCWDGDIRRARYYENADFLGAFVRDEAKDGRRAELFVTDNGGASRRLFAQVTTGAWTQTDFYGRTWIGYGATWFKLCTSNAGASRRCSGWI